MIRIKCEKEVKRIINEWSGISVILRYAIVRMKIYVKYFCCKKYSYIKIPIQNRKNAEILKVDLHTESGYFINFH